MRVMKDMEDIVRGDDGEDEGAHSSLGVARKAGLAIIAGALIASLTHRLLSLRGLEHTSLVFIGIPAIIGIVVVLMPRSTSVTGVILKTITLALALSGILLGEGFVCILFAAPLFYLVGVIIGIAADWDARRDQNRTNGTVMVVLLILGPTSLEGVIPGFEFGRDAAVTRTRVVAGSASDVEAALGRVPRFDRELPAFFKLGFPTPGVTGGEGDGTPDEEGVAAIGRALEHINFAWAFAGMAMRLPVVSFLLQALVDASGGGPQRIRRTCPVTARRPLLP